VATVISERVSHFISRLYSGEYREENFKRFVDNFHDLLEAGRDYRGMKVPPSELIASVMDRMGAGEDDKRLALYTSVVYDLGLMLVDENILSKKKLSSPEVRALKVHPHTTVSLLESFEFSEKVKKAILHHHERFDGTGYPDKLKGGDIPLISRVLNVVDSFYAMTSDRPYRKRFTKDKAMEEIRRDSGSIYDPDVVRALEKAVETL
jgi:HD-GYP domain-containing protein (c-di-GMP phosphodiesterase class II)